MSKKEFKAESKRLLEMMINSIYSQKEVFLRELLSNSSDAIDKIYYKALTDDSLHFNKESYYIKVTPDKADRTLTITDTGIGMTQEELESSLGTIARSGSLAFKNENETKDGHTIIGQFGVGFYAAFMVADVVTVISKALGSDKAYKWESTGADGYTIERCEKETVGTQIILKIKENTEDETYDEYLEEYRLKEIIKKYSDFIRYPIKMDITEKRPKEGSDNELEDYTEEQVINSMVPIWKKNKNELTSEDYEQFYSEKRYGFDKPLTHLHINVDGTIRYNAILFIPENSPFDYYSKEFEKGLELYSNGVLIMNKCADLLPDYFSFVKGMVDSEDLSLNISREILQQDRQLQLIAKNIGKKIKNELKSLLKNEREKYEKFYDSFGRQLKYGVYSDFGSNKDLLKDLLLFYSSTEKKLVTLDEYVSRMPEDQKYIYYASGESYDRIEKLPQAELVADKGYEILYFTEDIDEFAIKMLMTYEEKEFKSVSSSDLGIESEEEQLNESEEKENKELFNYMKKALAGKVGDVRASKRLKTHPVCLSADGEVTIEMEKILSAMPDNQHVKAEKVLEINVNHDVFASLKEALENDKAKLDLYTNLLYNQALLIEGLSISDPVEFTNDICKIMI
ncbi:molecular chaperone HtpG [Priestia megaterium]|uniref:Chaperone protein HtpG n=1 Tax=Priestia megaterium (strain ATCC 14581 / DSM 32 / CCUG 1817 / JCM 2506 / NBRC 15308 / NCIMB 9376 / NCTC 10342 / NRRL B-14308 / VKM B-512 / Ford 19) TaxID=1348623 RepID=A0A0B6ABB7_PRIM2|nr:molecular chaperone HtpG [Priestia megaterium]AJI22240.1 hsp90 family protein [Priestia megaterium NBRC 15308 = ATCC 14581]KFM96652.1 histidine kinase-, DNA gyrase B-, and HSP90-like ATPase family protein [Priestia megaterium]KGJ74074.1 chaperone protein HtpG [Priestia megaterium NBRC 15308 = ATCC 14581]MDH3187023.1 molecular chaperone HtpG [Priestia megaterium]MDR4231540.1 molecular chaperone HtpG [Priestia megaterium]